MEKLYTPREVNDGKILSYVQQWKERKSGRLKCYRVGRKILYSESHIKDYLALCTSEVGLLERSQGDESAR
jgi:hypothetical protein